MINAITHIPPVARLVAGGTGKDDLRVPKHRAHPIAPPYRFGEMGCLRLLPVVVLAATAEHGEPEAPMPVPLVRHGVTGISYSR
jgi:hypothetical protein